VKWDRETDVVVAGGGLAGYCAAIEAAAAGANVLLLEKQPRIGGSTLLSSGFFAFAGTELQRTAGIDDSGQRLFDDLRKAGGEKNDSRLVQVYVDHQLENYEWLKRQGIRFGSVELSSAQSVPRTHPLDIAKLMEHLITVARDSGRVQTLLDTPVERLLRAGTDGRVTGVRTRSGGAATNIRARCGVVLATGGFTRSERLLELFAPHQAKAVHYGGTGNTGDGLLMAWQLGAGFCDMAHIKGTFGFHPDSRTREGRGWTKLPMYRGAIAVNKHGRRYVDESSSYKLLGDAVLQQPDAIAWQIFDQDIMDTAVDGVSPFDFRDAQRRGLIQQADTLQALAEEAGIDTTQVQETVARYNGYVASGHDAEFGRDGLSTHYGGLRKIARAPFYAYASTSAVIGTYCGLTVDTDTRVLDVFGEPIPGLYAAGEIMGGFHGVAYMTGTALGKCLIFGRISGHTAVQPGR